MSQYIELKAQIAKLQEQAEEARRAARGAGSGTRRYPAEDR